MHNQIMHLDKITKLLVIILDSAPNNILTSNFLHREIFPHYARHIFTQHKITYKTIL